MSDPSGYVVEKFSAARKQQGEPAWEALPALPGQTASVEGAVAFALEHWKGTWQGKAEPLVSRSDEATGTYLKLSHPNTPKAYTVYRVMRSR